MDKIKKFANSKTGKCVIYGAIVVATVYAGKKIYNWVKNRKGNAEETVIIESVETTDSAQPATAE